MDIKGFIGQVTEAVREKLPDGYSVLCEGMKKNNGVILNGLCIKKEGSSVNPVIYMEPFFRDYRNGVPISDITDRILEVYRGNSAHDQLDMSSFTDFEKAKDKICFRLVNREANKELLEGIPYKGYLDLALCFFYVYDSDGIGSGTILINNEHLGLWGCTADDLMELAEKNTPRLFPVKSANLLDMLGETVGQLSPPEGASGLTVLTNTSGMNGATCIVYEGVLKELSEKLGGSLWVIPSSVHEVILHKCRPDDDPDYFSWMVKETNSTVLDPTDILSDSFYMYDRETDTIEKYIS